MDSQYLNIIGLIADVIGASILTYGLIISRKDAIELGVSRFCSEKEDENVKLPQVKDRLKQSKNAKIGLVFLFIGFVLQILGNWPSEVSSADFAGPVQYNCEKSAGVFENNTCICPVGGEDSGLTQEMMYDKSTGYCQSEMGGPAGDAFNASAGLPYGNYGFYNDVVQNNCTESGGEFMYACNCPEGKTYDKGTGFCKQA